MMRCLVQKLRIELLLNFHNIKLSYIINHIPTCKYTKLTERMRHSFLNDVQWALLVSNTSIRILEYVHPVLGVWHVKPTEFYHGTIQWLNHVKPKENLPSVRQSVMRITELNKPAVIVRISTAVVRGVSVKRCLADK